MKNGVSSVCIFQWIYVNILAKVIIFGLIELLKCLNKYLQKTLCVVTGFSIFFKN